MTVVGMFESEHTNLTFDIIKRILGVDNLKPVIISDNGEYNDSLDILIVNINPPATVLQRYNASYTCSAAVINTDDRGIISHLSRMSTRIVTYGLNSRASITASSVLGGKAIFCVQRSFPALNGVPVERQEFSISFPEPPDPAFLIVNCYLPAVTAALLLGVPSERISKTL